MSILIAGGEKDPNLGVLIAAAERASIAVVDLRVPAGVSPAFHWDLQSGDVRIDGRPAMPAAAFVRMDVFASLEEQRPAVATRALGWYHSIAGWLLAGAIPHFNRNISPIAHNKPAALALAARLGLRIPSTIISNDPAYVAPAAGIRRIAKPVAGGGYCFELEQAISDSGTGIDVTAPMPAIVQQRLIAPEVRIYIIGSSALAFEMRSPSLDYRVHQDAEVILLKELPPETGPLRALMERLSMDFGAADFKTDPDTGQLVFLELNTSPMFARFDYASEGRLSSQMIEALVTPQQYRFE